MKKIVLALLLAASYAGAKEKDAPSWVTEVATRALPVYSGKVPGAVLLDEQKVTVDANGVMDTVTRHAVKVLTHQGKRLAEVTEGYEKGGRQVKDLHAWIVAPNGFVKTFEKSSIEDLGAYSDELYNDYRLRRIKSDNAEVGAVFVYESEVSEKAMQAQDRFAFQSDLPSVESKYSITVPAGWTVSGTVLNHAPVAPVVDGNTYTWALKDLPFREAEDAAPHLYGTTPMLAVDFQAPAGVAGPPSFKAWSDVSRWYGEISAAQGEITPEMAAKVRELTTGASGEYDKIRTIGRFVQQVRYVEIAMDLSHNGGYRPHAASQVFVKQYGDCKDKANLLRALLKSAGIESYPVIIYSGDRTHVKKDWASPSQFNHMILAIRTSDASQKAAELEAGVGRVLLFDPTDDKTPMGDIPYHEQGSYAVLCAGAKGDLIQMPVIAPETNVLAEKIQATLDGSGKLTATVMVESHGQAARNERLKHDVPAEQYKSQMERFLNYYAKGAAVSKIEAHDDFDKNVFSSDLEFASDSYGQVMQNRMLVFNPSIVEPAAHQYPVEKERSQPVVLNGRVYKKQTSIAVPEGFKVDEMPDPYKAEAPFAKFSIGYRQEAGKIIVEEELRTEAVIVPATEYPKVKKFFDNVFGADAQKVVLVKN
jgi:transglutaminase-like putative cysteine protease